MSVMDRKIEKKKWTPKLIGMIAAGTLVVGFVIFQLFFADSRSSMNVNMERITIATVKEGEFTDYIPVSGNIEPGEVFFLDALGRW
jgi:HlyD family secretion protein